MSTLTTISRWDAQRDFLLCPIDAWEEFIPGELPGIVALLIRSLRYPADPEIVFTILEGDSVPALIRLARWTAAGAGYRPTHLAYKVEDLAMGRAIANRKMERVKSVCEMIEQLKPILQTTSWAEQWLTLKGAINKAIPEFFTANGLQLFPSPHIQEALNVPLAPYEDAIQCSAQFLSSRGLKTITLIVASIPDEAFEICLFSLAPSPGRRIFRGTDVEAAVAATREALAVKVAQLNNGQEKVIRLG